jgi:hypothetical protein
MTTKSRISLFSVLLIIALVLTAWCWPANAEDFPPGEDQIVPLAVGDRAPFEGQLFETTTAIRWGFRIQSLRLRLDADVAAANESCAVQTELLTTKLNLAQERFDFNVTMLTDARDQLQAQVVQLTEALADAQDTPWYRSWTFGLVVGIVGAGLLAVGGAYLASAI